MDVFSFGLFLGLFVLIGLLSLLQNKHNTQDYLLASYSIKPCLTALSAAATNNSGYSL